MARRNSGTSICESITHPTVSTLLVQAYEEAKKIHSGVIDYDAGEFTREDAIREWPGVGYRQVGYRLADMIAAGVIVSLGRRGIVRDGRAVSTWVYKFVRRTEDAKG